jgi:transposase
LGGRDRTAVSKFIKRYNARGDFNQEGSGRPRKMDHNIEDALIRHAVLELKRGHYVSCAILREYCKEFYGVEVSLRTIARRLNESNCFKAIWQKRSHLLAK